MRGSAIRFGVVAGAIVAATGCASTDMGARTAVDAPDRGHMSMPHGISTVTAGDQAPKPSETASMVCGEEIRHDVQQAFGVSSLASGRSMWADGLFTCTYQTPSGRLVLSVQDATEPAAGRIYFEALRAQVRPVHALRGLEAFGLPAYESAKGQVIFLKDGKTLQVDATALQPASGPHRISPAEVAYAVAADVIGCWSE